MLRRCGQEKCFSSGMDASADFRSADSGYCLLAPLVAFGCFFLLENDQYGEKYDHADKCRIYRLFAKSASGSGQSSCALTYTGAIPPPPRIAKKGGPVCKVVIRSSKPPSQGARRSTSGAMHMILSAQPTVARHFPFTSCHSALAVTAGRRDRWVTHRWRTRGCWPILFLSINFSRDLSIFEAFMDTAAKHSLRNLEVRYCIRERREKKRESVCITVKSFAVQRCWHAHRSFIDSIRSQEAQIVPSANCWLWPSYSLLQGKDRQRWAWIGKGGPGA